MEHPHFWIHAASEATNQMYQGTCNRVPQSRHLGVVFLVGMLYMNSVFPPLFSPLLVHSFRELGDISATWEIAQVVSFWRTRRQRSICLSFVIEQVRSLQHRPRTEPLPGERFQLRCCQSSSCIHSSFET